MQNVLIMLANGFEEIEGLTVVDLLRRAGIETTLVSIESDKRIEGAHGIKVEADTTFECVKKEMETADMIVLPGGMPGTKHLRAHEELCSVLTKRFASQKWIAAICAAPSLILGDLGLLEGLDAVCYPGMEDNMKGAHVKNSPVAIDGSVITSKGVGTAISFALTIIEVLDSKEKAEEIQDSIVYKSAK